MNSVHLIGRTTAAPVAGEHSGTQVARLRLAVQRPRGKDGEDRGAEFVDVVTFGRQAEVCVQYLAKGRRVAVEGHLHHSEWQDADGARRQKLEVIAERVQFLDAPRHSEANGDGHAATESDPADQPAEAAA